MKRYKLAENDFELMLKIKCTMVKVIFDNFMTIAIMVMIILLSEIIRGVK